MKATTEEQEIVRRMTDRGVYGESLLGHDRRSLVEILAADVAEVDRLRLTHSQIARRLEELLGEAVAAQGRPLAVSERMAVTYLEGTGHEPCPWLGPCGRHPRGEVELIDEKTGQRIRFTPLSIHMIGHHGFYQGHGARHRIEPRHIARMLRLVTFHPAEEGGE